MLKSITLKLSKIKYRGSSIGDDIRVEIEILDTFLRVDKRIKSGTTAAINQGIGRFETDRGLFQADMVITVIEKDLLFNDAAKVRRVLKINTTSVQPQQFIFDVRINETRSASNKFWGKAAAVFEITLEANVADAIRYVTDDGDGWLKVILDDKQTEVSLPAYLKVRVSNSNNKREYFTILEGPYRGKTSSVKLREDGFSRFMVEAQHEPMIRAKYSISQKTFILKNRKYKTVDYRGSLWRKGVYDIEIPDYPHKGGRNYLDKSPRALTWFRIGHSGDRYLHTGLFSLGCMTIVEPKRWMEIYNVLIRARKGDFLSVGTVEIID